MSSYIEETYEKIINGQSTIVVNLKPVFCKEELNSLKKIAENRLYDIFCKYTKKNA